MIKNAFYNALVDYNYKVGNKTTRATISIAATQDPANRPADSFFVPVLQRRHPGATITINSVQWP